MKLNETVKICQRQNLPPHYDNIYGNNFQEILQ